MLGWDRIRIEGRSAHELNLLPGGNYLVESALADSQTFREGDHRVRCVVSWFDPISYPRTGLTIADMMSAAFPALARDCYLADGEGQLQPHRCDLPHSDQTMVTFNLLGAFDPGFVLRAADTDDDLVAETGRFCSAVLRSVYGPWDEREYFSWSSRYGSADWAALLDEVDPDGNYLYGCLLSTDSTLTSDDLLATLANDA